MLTIIKNSFVIFAFVMFFPLLLSSTAFTQNNTPPRVEVVFVLDTTGSMGGLIAAAKQKIWSIANTLATAKPAPQIKMGIIGYRDRQDSYITKMSQLSDDLDIVYSSLMALQAGGGGDAPESVNQALYEAITKIQWSQDPHVYKVIYLVGDAPPHMDYQDDIKYDLSCKMAKEKDIIINTIQCGSMSTTATYWRQIAKLGSGEYFRVSQSGSAVHYKTPYDTELARLSRDLDKTRIYYGDSKKINEAKERTKKSAFIYDRADSSSVAQRAEFNAKSAGKKNFLGDNELIDDIANKKIKIEKINQEHLPSVMKAMTAEQRKHYLVNQAKKRNDLQKEIISLSQKRQTFIKRQVDLQGNKGKNSLDMKIYNSIKKQAAKKNLKYEHGVCY